MRIFPRTVSRTLSLGVTGACESEFHDVAGRQEYSIQEASAEHHGVLHGNWCHARLTYDRNGTKLRAGVERMTKQIPESRERGLRPACCWQKCIAIQTDLIWADLRRRCSDFLNVATKRSCTNLSLEKLWCGRSLRKRNSERFWWGSDSRVILCRC